MANLFDGFPIGRRTRSEIWVLIVARISTTHQDPRSLDDQIALCRKYVADRYSGPVRFRVIKGQGSGEYLDRKDLAETEAAVESREYDLIIVEDLGRICRRHRAFDVCENCEDAGTRLIAINDSIDTARDDWRMHALFASFKHESGNKDTSDRIIRTLDNRFAQGGVVQTFPYGYIKPAAAKSDSDISKDPNAEPIIERIFSMLEAGASYCEVADWLNAENVPIGRWCRSVRWTGRMAARLVHNTILKGSRRRKERKSKRLNKDGRPRSVKAEPKERLFRHAPHLQFIEPARYDRLIRTLSVRHANCARGRKAGAADCRAGVSRKNSIWPGQHVVCGVCGYLYVWGGHGQTGHLMCDGAREYACWNGATFDGNKAGPQFTAAVLDFAESLPGFDEMFLTKATALALTRRSDRAERLRRLDQQIGQVDRELEKLVDAVATVEFSPALRAKLKDTEDRKSRLEGERYDLLLQPDDVPELPPIDELKERWRVAVGRMAFADPAYGRLMRQLVPTIEVYPYRLLDGGAVVLRARLTITLSPLLGAAADIVGPLLTRTVMVNLFSPPQRVAFRERVVALRAAGKSERAVGQGLDLTITATQRAMSLHRMMIAAGMTDPYRLLMAPPNDDSKIRRHKHLRYDFRPRASYPAWPKSSEQNAA